MASLTLAQCRLFQNDPGTNPATGRLINIGGPTYNRLVKQCLSHGIAITPKKPSPSPLRPIPAPYPSPAPQKEDRGRSKDALPLPKPTPDLVHQDGVPLPLERPRPHMSPQVIPSPTIHGGNPRDLSKIHMGETIADRYQLIQKLGSGSFGVTFLAYDLVNNINVAIKTIDRVAYGDHTSFGTIEDEIQSLKDFTEDGCNRYVMCYFDNFTQDWKGKLTTFIVSEYIDSPSLYDFRHRMKGKTPRDILIPLMYQLLLGLKTIHDRGYAHRDIKPANIMFPRKKQIRYIDFGFACLEACRIENCHNVCRGTPGSMKYDPPEYFTKTRPPNTLEAAQAHDIWSLGIVFYELTNVSRYPFDDQKPDREIIERLLTSINEADYLNDFEDFSISRLIDSMLTLDWKSRPNINQVIFMFVETIATKIE